MSNIVRFPVHTPPAPQGWQQTELQQVMAACSASISSGEVSGWEIGYTETGEPQVYLVGPPPDYDCILCISRVGWRYVIEDGQGRVVYEHDSSLELAEQTLAALRRRKDVLLAKIAIVWHAFREAVEEKTEAVTGESMEVLAHIAPQLATLV